MAETRYICKHSDGMGHCKISDDWCCSGPCTLEEDIEYTPVVRCWECKHLMFSDCYGECGKGHMGIVSPDDFCSYGERKEGAE